MAVSSSRARNAESSLIPVPRKFKDREEEETTPDERTKFPQPKYSNKTPSSSSSHHNKKKVAVVYYISRNGQLEHPHFIEVPLSSPQGLYLKDVISRLNILRGKGMASLYSWSSKRSYKNGFVWHDLAENDFIYPAHGHEYVLKGSELLLDPSINAGEPLLLEPKPSETRKSIEDFPVITRRRNQSWSSIDLNEYRVYKAEPFSESSRKLAADASTQTDDKRRRRRPVKEPEEIEELQEDKSREEIEVSPPPSDSSPETLESLMKADGRLILAGGSGNGHEDGLNHPTVENCGRLKASTVLMQLISCGSVSFRDCGATAVKGQGLSLIGQYKARLPRGGETMKDFSSCSRVRLEDKEYFSGSLIETKKEAIPALKRSNSYNADRCVKVQMGEKEEEEEGARTRCIPRKSKGMMGSKKENNNMSLSSNNSQVGSKRFEVQQLQNDTV